MRCLPARASAGQEAACALRGSWNSSGGSGWWRGTLPSSSITDPGAAPPNGQTLKESARERHSKEELWVGIVEGPLPESCSGGRGLTVEPHPCGGPPQLKACVAADAPQRSSARIMPTAPFALLHNRTAPVGNVVVRVTSTMGSNLGRIAHGVCRPGQYSLAIAWPQHRLESNIDWQMCQAMGLNERRAFLLAVYSKGIGHLVSARESRTQCSRRVALHAGPPQQPPMAVRPPSETPAPRLQQRPRAPTAVREDDSDGECCVGQQLLSGGSPGDSRVSMDTVNRNRFAVTLAIHAPLNRRSCADRTPLGCQRGPSSEGVRRMTRTGTLRATEP